MNYSELITKRFSTRSFTSQKVEKETIYKIIEAARLAPSAVNYQPWHFIVIDDDSAKSKIQEVYGRDWFKNANVYFIACANHDCSWVRSSDKKDFATIDVAIAIQQMILQATELNIGSCWVCNFDVAKLKEIFNIPEHIEPVAIIPMGYTDAKALPKNRKLIKEIVSWNEFK